MDGAVVERLLDLNQAFYGRFATPFVETRAAPQEGFFKLLDYLPQSAGHLLDVGCGDGRFGRFSLAHDLAADYTGLDFSADMLQAARSQTTGGTFIQRDMSQADCLAGLGSYALISCLATMQHIPGWVNRLRLMQEMAAHLAPNGRIVLSNWQFLDSDRQRRKITPWSKAGLLDEDVEENDYLLTWQRGGKGYRYVAFIDSAETEKLSETAGLRCLAQFRSDGREGDLNLYTILSV
ncbi:MAG: methyltransferase domain-containing protein [Candidatus Promineifilaceae bacterium]